MPSSEGVGCPPAPSEGKGCMRKGSSIGIAIGGTAVVCCVHDREKRKIVTEAQVKSLGASVGQVLDPKQHKLFLCVCCENLFVDTGDKPKFCHQCRQSLVHKLGGPLPEPRGRI